MILHSAHLRFESFIIYFLKNIIIVLLLIFYYYKVITIYTIVLLYIHLKQNKNQVC
jgi:hypothetical protein